MLSSIAALESCRWFSLVFGRSWASSLLLDFQMQPVPRIFVSATSRDLRTARTLVSEGLRRMECLPIVQDDFPPDYKSVKEMLRAKISDCDAVVHLAGFYYGAEPQPVPEDSEERRSFTQLEYEVAVELGLPCYVFICGENFPFDEHELEPEEKRQLQIAHRERLLKRDEVYYEFDTREDLNSRTRELQLKVESLRDELAKERTRRRMTLGIAAAALLVTLAGGAFLYLKTQSQQDVIAETTGKLDAQQALIEQLIAEQERLRGEKGDFAGLAEQAERNVAEANNQSPEEIRAAIDAAIVDAKEAVVTAQESGDSPAIAAALLQLAEAELAAGRKTEAIAAYRERLTALDRDETPAEWAETAAVLANTLYWRNTQLPEPRELLVEGVRWANKNPELGPYHPATLEMASKLSLMLPSGEGLLLAEHVHEGRTRDLGPEAPDTLEAGLILARIYKILGRFDEADSMFQQVIATREKLYGESDKRTITAKWDLAQSLVKQRRFSEAESMLRQLEQTSAEAYGPGDPDTLSLAMAVAYLYRDRGDEAAATKIYRKTFATSEEANGLDNATTQSLGDNLAIQLVEMGDYLEAKKVGQRVLDSRVRTIGENQGLTIGSMGTLALALNKLGDTDAYKELMLRRIAAKIAVYGPDDPGIAGDQFSLALELASAGQYQIAVPFFEEAYTLYKRVKGPEDPETTATLTMLGIATLRMEDYEAAEKWNDQLFDQLVESETTSEAQMLDIAEVAYRLALAKEELGKSEAALTLAEQARKLGKKYAPEDHWLHPRTAEMLERLE